MIYKRPSYFLNWIHFEQVFLQSTLWFLSLGLNWTPVSDGIATGPTPDEKHSRTWNFWWKFSCLQIDTFASRRQSQQLYPKAFLPANALAQVFGDLTTEGHKKQMQHLIWQIFTKKMAPILCRSHPTVIILLASVPNLESPNGRKPWGFFWGNKIYLE